MNVLVLGKAKTGTTVISKTILNSLPKGAQYVFEPCDTAPFEQRYGAPGTVTKVLFDHWTHNKRELQAAVHNGHALQFDKRVVLRRDPRDEVISLLLYYPFDLKRAVADLSRFDAWIDFLAEKEAAPGAISFLDMCRKFDSLFNVNFTPSLSRLHTLDGGYLRFCQQMTAPHYVYKYEDFMKGETRHLARYIGVDLTDERDVGDKYAQTYRSGSHDNWKRYYTPQDIDFFKQYAEYFDMLGYSDWELAPVDSLPSEELSGYVRKLLK